MQIEFKVSVRDAVEVAVCDFGVGGYLGGICLLYSRLTAVRKKLFSWLEVLVLRDRSLLPEGTGTKRLCPG